MIAARQLLRRVGWQCSTPSRERRASGAVEGVGFGGCFRTSVACPPRLLHRADRRLHGLVGRRSSSRIRRAAQARASDSSAGWTRRVAGGRGGGRKRCPTKTPTIPSPRPNAHGPTSCHPNVGDSRSQSAHMRKLDHTSSSVGFLMTGVVAWSTITVPIAKRRKATIACDRSAISRPRTAPPMKIPRPTLTGCTPPCHRKMTPTSAAQVASQNAGLFFRLTMVMG